MKTPNPHIGLRHVALFCQQLEACEQFYVGLLGFTVDWKPDADNIYLTSGYDNLALHRAKPDFEPSKHQHLDHLGVVLQHKSDVDDWFDFLTAHQADIRKAPKDHRDNTRSFYCADPDGNIVQLIWIPNIR